MCWHGWYQIFKQLPAIVPRGSIVQIETMTAQRQERNGAWRRRAFCPRIALIALWAVACLVASSAVHATTTERVVVNRFSGLAIEGFDPVAYFVQEHPVLGLPDFEAAEAGAVWRFHNEGNRAPPLSPIRRSMTVRPPASCRPISATRISSTQSGTPSWRRHGSRTFGGIDGPCRSPRKIAWCVDVGPRLTAGRVARSLNGYPLATMSPCVMSV